MNPFESEKIKNIVHSAITKFALPVDREKMIADVDRSINHDLIRTLSSVFKKYFTTQRTMKALMYIAEKLSDLIEVQIVPEILEMERNENAKLKVYIQNRAGIPLKIRLRVEQKTGDSPLIFDVKRGFSDINYVREVLMDDMQTKLFRVNIKTDILGMKDLKNLKEKGMTTSTLHIIVESPDITGLRKGPIPCTINIHR